MTDKERLVELLKEAGDRYLEKQSYMLTLDRKYRIVIDPYDFYIDHLIANGVVVQKQGEWKGTERQPNIICECSLCKEKWGYGAMLHMNYCPNCGAKMVKEDK